MEEIELIEFFDFVLDLFVNLQGHVILEVSVEFCELCDVLFVLDVGFLIFLKLLIQRLAVLDLALNGKMLIFEL